MSGFPLLFFDPYDRKARLQPALLTAISTLVSIMLLIPELGSIWASIGGLFLYCGATTFLTQVGRDRGKSAEPSLYRSWDGKPSVAMLRNSDTRIDETTKERYRSFLNKTVPGLTLASEAEECKCSKKADEGYESATIWLRAHTRDREKFNLLFRENMNYGFRRNIYALKPWAWTFDIVAISFVVFLNFDLLTGKTSTIIQSITMENWTCIMMIVIHALIFAFALKERWVRAAADAYAQQLLAACDILDSERRN